MGRFWLHDMADVLRPGVGRGIVEVVEVHGWMTRSRGSGGMDSINGILKHHTASPASWDWEKDIQYLAFTNPYAPSPISNLYHGREGKVAIVAAGASNHGGLGGAYKPGGPIYVGVDRANQTLIGNEMGNAGTGEQWPWEQILASITTDALICLAERLPPGAVFAHKEYCGPGTTQAGRKIDPFGPWENHPLKWWPDGSSWGPGQGAITAYRTLVEKKMAELSQEINVMHGFIPRPETVPPRILDSRGPDGPNHDAYKVKPGAQFTVTVPQGAGKSHAIVNIVGVEANAPGFFQAWPGGPRPTSSELNFGVGAAIANEVTVELAPDGTFQMYSPVSVHVVIDLKGYYQPM